MLGIESSNYRVKLRENHLNLIINRGYNIPGEKRIEQT
jgi:hypothetical protein